MEPEGGVSTWKREGWFSSPSLLTDVLQPVVYGIANFLLIWDDVIYLWQITVNCIENLPPVELVLREHVYLSVGDYFLSTRASRLN